VRLARGLNRAEVKACKGTDDNTSEVKIVTAALVDPEGLTEDEVAAWLEDAPAGDYVKVMQAITELSGLDKESAKSVQLGT
jgi:predicted transcriptional regulator